tara:strand:+ start:376 stop:681 length:306 start_codon:yes stop_codon:yes gene_type:complete
MALKSNISGTVVTSVLAAGDNVSKIQTIRLTNTHASTVATVDLFIDSDSLGTFYIIKNVSIPVGVSLILNEGVSFDNSINGYTLYTKLGAGTIDILINRKI